jgi:hypothetical protein
MAKQAKRITTNVDVPPEEYGRLAEWCRSKGRIQRDVLGKLITWFLSQRQSVWRAVIDDVDEDMKSAYANVLRKLADELDAPGRTGVGATDRPEGIELHAR